MLDYRDIRSNYETIKKFCKKYRKEITVYQGCFIESNGITDYSTYTRIMNEMSDDEFIGNMFTALLNYHYCELIDKILKGKLELNDMIKNLYGEELFETYLSRL